MEETKPQADEQADCQWQTPIPNVVAADGDSKRVVALKLRAEIERRADIASRMRFGKSRACEFAYIAGLADAAELLDGKHLYLACPKPRAVVFDGEKRSDVDSESQ